MENILVTGGAGFVGYHLVNKLILQEPAQLYLLDDLNDYYPPVLKYKRLEKLGIQYMGQLDWVTSSIYPNVHFAKADIADKLRLEQLISFKPVDFIFHLAAQAGVRYSFTHPETYLHSNLIGFFNVLELAKQLKVRHMIYASSSSVYGNNASLPFHESDPIMHPMNLYAATKASNELMAYAYSSLYKIPMTALRFFTVYGPFGRPDMAYFKFADNIIHQRPIAVHGNGLLKRDFTFIDDIVVSMVLMMNNQPTAEIPHEVYNIGNHHPVELLYFIELLENFCGKKAILQFVPEATGEMQVTYADIDKLVSKIGYQPETSLETGLERFMTWYLSEDNPLQTI